VAGAAFVLALATIVVSLFRQPLDLVVSLAGLVIATSLAIAAILAVGPIRKIAVIAAFAFAAVTPSLLLLAGEPVSAVVVVLLLAVAAQGARRAARRGPPTPGGAHPRRPGRSEHPSGAVLGKWFGDESRPEASMRTAITRSKRMWIFRRETRSAMEGSSADGSR
jgi:hypothetical protein